MAMQPKDPKNQAQIATALPPSRIGVLIVDAIVAATL